MFTWLADKWYQWRCEHDFDYVEIERPKYIREIYVCRKCDKIYMRTGWIVGV